MRMTIAVFNAPNQFRDVANAALLFAKAALSQHNHISQIFFYRSGVLNAANNNAAALEWQNLQVSLKVCRTTALEYNLSEKTLHSGFEFSTLTDFFQDIFRSDKYVIFAE
jgi:sulfur relay (sulfurtransferase) complex TusBCD TusD component (DsrE family)